jgi:signal transduction histidine kinase
VATNYLTNALKYAPVDRPIEVWLEVVGNTVRVCVRDQGPGLPPDELDRVWNRWHQVPGIGHQSGSHIGLGMGLYISKSIVERHQGQVGVESVLGNGSIFWFTLPLLNSPA